jgi:FKBP-type peptidyl-prolyl cis-trans isomerase
MNKKYLILVLVALAILGLGTYLGAKNAEVNKKLSIADNNNENSNMQENNNQPGELKIEILKEGTGAVATSGDKVSVNYVGTFEDGQVFDSNTSTSSPFSFTLGAGEVIKGWDLGVAGMKVGEKRKLTVPYNLGYGESGYGPIPAKATLIFEVDLLGINK